MIRKKTNSWYSSSSWVYSVLITFFAGLCLMIHSPFSTNIVFIRREIKLTDSCRVFHTTLNINYQLVYLWKLLDQYRPTPVCGCLHAWEPAQSHWHCKSESCTQGESMWSVSTTNTVICSLLQDSMVRGKNVWPCLYKGTWWVNKKGCS